jgi:hypothetical protein
VDFVSKRYGQLPSKVIQQGHSIDIWIAQIGVGYENYLHDKAHGKVGTAPSQPTVTKEQMMEMWNRVKQDENKNKL